mgnify:CR=1 FL=1
MHGKSEAIVSCLFGEGGPCDPTCDRFRACWGFRSENIMRLLSGTTELKVEKHEDYAN